LQGFVQFPKQQTIRQLKKLHKKVHWEPRRGSALQASHYCKKPVADCECKHCADVPRIYPQLIFENGALSAPAGEKLQSVADYLKRHGLSKTIEAYPTHYMAVKHGMEALATFYSPVRQWQTVVTVLWGEPNLGKTRYALMGPSPYKLAVFGQGTDFFGDYRPDCHDTLVVDDFYGNWKYTTFLQVCDRYPTEVHTKGGFRQLLVHHIVFTSNRGPSEWYPKVLAEMDRRESFNRRIHNIIHFTAAGYIINKGDLPWPGLDWIPMANVNQILMFGQNQPPQPLPQRLGDPVYDAGLFQHLFLLLLPIYRTDSEYIQLYSFLEEVRRRAAWQAAGPQNGDAI